MVELKVSTPVKIFALVAIVAGLGGVGALTFLGGDGGASASAVDGVQLDEQGRVISAVGAGTKRSANSPSRATPAKVALKPPSTATRPSKPRRTVAPNGLPRTIADALRAHPAVVVALYTPQGKIDPMGLAEAKQGAALARVGFVGVNVFNTRTAGPLMTKLGVVLRAPAVLIFRRSGDLSMRIDGFADRETVAQAALNAAA